MAATAPTWTVADVPPLDGATAVVTGANSGIGFPVARELARAGATTVLAVRDPGRGAAARDRILAAAPGASVAVVRLDLAELASVRRAAAEILDRHPRIDVLVDNAGIMATPRRITADGFELQLATNHLGHFALTGLLLPALSAAPSARVVTVTSYYARRGRVELSDLDRERRYRPFDAYAQSKLANLLFAVELDRRARAAGLPLASVAAHPGWAATNLQTAGPRMAGSKSRERGARLLNRWLAQSDEDGALPTLRAAVDPDVQGGEFYGPGGGFGIRGAPVRIDVYPGARDPRLAADLWAVSEQRTGVTYDLPTAGPLRR